MCSIGTPLLRESAGPASEPPDARADTRRSNARGANRRLRRWGLASGDRLRTDSTADGAIQEVLMAKRTEGRPSDEDVELGEEAEARRKPGAAMVAVRVSSELLERIQNYSRANGLTVSEAMRMGAEQLVAAP